MNYETILVERKDAIGIIKLNRPERRNALNAQLIDDVVKALHEFDADPEVHVIVIMSTHPKVFCAGRDLAEGSSELAIDIIKQREISNGPARLFLAIRSLNKVVIAGVNGFALAGGTGLAIWCDLTVAAEDAIFGFPEANIGLFPSVVAPALGYNTASVKKCLELILTGDRMDAQEAERLGLVNKVVPPDRLEEATIELAQNIASKSPATLQVVKKTFYNMLNMEYTQATKYGTEITAMLAVSEDGIEGQRAFLEKRQPQWKKLT
ncbi:enoyl-CoA hydratase/isomerase family protein [Chloroflexota bacterium]